MIHSCLVCVFVLLLLLLLLLCCLLWDDNSAVDIALLTPWFIRRSGSRKTNLVLERLWSLWTEFDIHTSGDEDLCLQHYMSWRSSWLELREFYFRLWTEEFWVWNLRHWVRVKRDELLDDVPSSIFCFGRATYSSLTILITNVIWTQRYFLFNPLSTLDRHGIEHPYNVVM